jgi:NAD(P)-dependent dehydrogenase (short-subunit alcohol dehydrogenase family)
MSKLAKKVIVITGASEGIGLSCALICLRHEAKVALIARDSALARTDITAAGVPFDQNVLALSADARDAQSVESGDRRGWGALGRLAGVINNAGWHPLATTIDETSL